MIKLSGNLWLTHEIANKFVENNSKLEQVTLFDKNLDEKIFNLYIDGYTCKEMLTELKIEATE